jgi:hypothetical protein
MNKHYPVLFSHISFWFTRWQLKPPFKRLFPDCKDQSVPLSLSRSIVVSVPLGNVLRCFTACVCVCVCYENGLNQTESHKASLVWRSLGLVQSTGQRSNLVSERAREVKNSNVAVTLWPLEITYMGVSVVSVHTLVVRPSYSFSCAQTLLVSLWV